MKNKFLCIILCATSISFQECSAPEKVEAVMPFYNFGYTASRPQPIALNDATFAFRIWINNGTSMERVISISKSKDLGDEAYMTEISESSKRNKPEKFYSKNKIIPKSGVDNFIKKVDSLNLFEYENGSSDNIGLRMHQPFSMYVVEIKKDEKYHCFKFYTVFPNKTDTITKYERLEQLIFSEFKYEFYFKKD